jgi:hypothetical protein
MHYKISFLIAALCIFNATTYSSQSPRKPQCDHSPKSTQTQHRILSPLSKAIRDGEVDQVKKLLADPSITINDHDANSSDLSHAICMAVGALDEAQKPKYLSIVRVLLYMGYNPHHQVDKFLTPAQTAQAFQQTDPDCANYITEWQKPETYCSWEELADFKALKSNPLR